MVYHFNSFYFWAHSILDWPVPLVYFIGGASGIRYDARDVTGIIGMQGKHLKFTPSLWPLVLLTFSSSVLNLEVQTGNM